MASHPALTSLSNRYCELHAHSYYSLLDGVPTPQQLVDRAVELGLPALALIDHNTVAGLAAFYTQALAAGIHPILGTEITLQDGSHLTLLAETDAGYLNLCQLITASHANGPAQLRWDDLKQHTQGLIALTGCRQGPVARQVAANDLDAASHWLSYLGNLFGRGNLYVELQRNLGRDDVKISRRLAALAAERGLPCVATGNVHYLTPQDAPLHNALVGLQKRLPLTAAEALRATGEYFMRSPRAMADLFADLPEAIANTQIIAQRCNAQPVTGAQRLPAFALPEDTPAEDYLLQLCLPRLSRHFPENTKQARAWLDLEVDAISQLGLASYFLIVSDVASYCERHGILYQVQGASANGVVATLLGLGAGPATAPLSFSGLPQLDFVLDAARRDSVLEYIRERWGAAQVATAGTYLTFNATAALREAGFVLAINPQAITDLTNSLSGADLAQPTFPDPPVARLVSRLQAQATGLSPAQRQQLFTLAGQLQYRPYALTADANTLLLTAEPAAQVLPVDSSTGQSIVQLDREALHTLGVTTLGLQGRAMLTALAEAQAFVPRDERQVDLRKLDFDDQAVYDLITSSRAIGVLQENGGVTPSLLPHLQSQSYQDLVVEASLILQPSLLRNSMVQHYLHRRQGLEPVLYAQPLVEPILKDTLGVLVFEEQALQIARQVAGFTQAQADSLQQAFAQANPTQAIGQFQAQFIEGALCNNLPYETAEQVWNMLVVFAGGAFSEVQATTLATLIYWSAWLRLHHPAQYFCGVLRQALMGSYPASVLESEATRSGLKFLPCDINRSQPLPTLERGAIRQGLIQQNGLDAATAQLIVSARGQQPFRSLPDLIERTHLERRTLEWLILFGAFDSLGYRPHLLWELAEAFNVARRPEPAQPDNAYIDYDDMLEEPSLFMKFAASSEAARMQLSESRRDAFTRAGCWVWGKLRKARVGSKVKVGGLVVEGLRRLPDSNGAAFLRIDEPEGSIKVTIPQAVYLADRVALRSAFLVIEGTVESQGQSVGIVARKVRALA